ncbi:hypothetical protein Tco_1270794 [Tanacetum coccineum]
MARDFPKNDRNSGEGSGNDKQAATKGRVFYSNTNHAASASGLNLSPQPPIDALALKENEDVANFVSDSELGLETSVTYPYWREERHHSRWSAESYRARGKP